MRLVALVATAMVLLASSASAWSQDGGDAGRSGWIPAGGPALPEVALSLAPPEGEAWHRDYAPLAWGREVLAMTDRAIWAIEVDAGAFRKVADNPPWNSATPFPIQPASGWAILDDLLFVAERRMSTNDCIDEPVDCGIATPATLRIVPLSGGSELAWALSDAGWPRECSVAVEPDAIYTACSVDNGVNPSNTHSVLEVRRLALDGSVMWTWRKETDPEAPTKTLLQAAPHVASARRVLSLTVAGDVVIPVTRTQVSPSNWYWDGWVLDKATGRLAGAAPEGPRLGTEGHFGPSCNQAIAPSPPSQAAPSLAIGDADGWVRKEPSCPLNSALFNSPSALRLVLAPPDFARQADQLAVLLRGDDAGARLALTPERIFAGTDRSVAAFTRQGEPLWDRDLPSGLTTLPLPFGADEDRLYGFLASELQAPARLSAWRALDGAPLWEHGFDGVVTTVGAGPGLVAAVVQRADGTTRLVLVGATRASVVLRSEVSDLYPKPGSLVRVDLSGSTAGLHGPPTRFRAEWGDGSATPWQDSPVLEHGYNALGDHVALVFAASDAGQVSSQAITFHVGRAPPQNWMQERFSDENQESTFFLLGLAITGVFAGAGIVRVQRRRGLLAREIEELDEAVRTARERAAVDRALDERRYRARTLLLDHRLDESQHAVLVQRIEEQARAARLDLLDRELDFLPVRHARALREMLHDGRISSFEREAYLVMLDADATLTAEYKARVRDVVEQWARRDAGAGA